MSGVIEGRGGNEVNNVLEMLMNRLTLTFLRILSSVCRFSFNSIRHQIFSGRRKKGRWEARKARRKERSKEGRRYSY